MFTYTIMVMSAGLDADNVLLATQSGVSANVACAALHIWETLPEPFLAGYTENGSTVCRMFDGYYVEVWREGE